MAVITSLSAYEREQLERIAGCKAEAPFLLVEVFEKLTHPLVSVAKQFLPEAAVTDAIEVAYKASEVVAHRDEIAARAGVKDIRRRQTLTLSSIRRMPISNGNRFPG